VSIEKKPTNEEMGKLLAILGQVRNVATDEGAETVGEAAYDRNYYRDLVQQYGPENPRPGCSPYDKSCIMTPEEIVELKRYFSEYECFEGIASYVAARYSTRLAVKYAQDEENYATLPGYVSNFPKDLTGRLHEAAWLAGQSAAVLLTCCNMPGDEWLEDVSTPSDFAVELETVLEEQRATN
jgi:hypothetical protein